MTIELRARHTGLEKDSQDWVRTVINGMEALYIEAGTVLEGFEAHLEENGAVVQPA